MVSTSFAAPVGDVLDGKFRVTKEIGRGGMATVYAAENIGIGKQVAVKILAEDLTTSKTVNERFVREARAAARIQSPYICEVYDVGTYRDRPFIVMELLEGESLYDKLARERQLSAEETLRIAVQTARGLKKAHDINVVHRDLKPENIFLTRGEDGAVHTKLVDFGLAKFYEPNQDPGSARLTKEGALFGTPAYMSPEQAKGKGNVDQRSDLWALGCIVFEMLTGRTVWDVDQGVAMILAQIASAPIPRARDYRPDLPPLFDEWLAKALSRKVESRFQDADEFIAALRSALSPNERHSPPQVFTPNDAILKPLVAPSALPSDAGSEVSPGLNQSPRDSAKGPRRYWYAGAAFVVGTGLGGWLYFGGLDALMRGPAPKAESAPSAEEIAEAQALLSEGEPLQSAALLKNAFEQSQSKAARSLLSHVSVAKDSAKGSCRLDGIAHPRPFESTTDSSKPSLLETPEGLLVTWADATTSGGPTHARTALLDSSLRRTTPVGDLTPEAHTARDPELLRTPTGAGLVFWDFDGAKPGAYTRLLDAHGALAGPARLLSSSTKKHPYYPAVARDPEGGFWAVWVEPSRDRVFDLVVRQLNDSLEPVGSTVAITGYATPVRGKTQAARPSIALDGKLLVITYTLRRGTKQQLMMLRVPKDAVKSGSGVVPDSRPETPGDEESDRFLGQVVQISERPGGHDQSTVRCTGQGCFVTWDDAQNAAFVAKIDGAGSVLWRRSLGDGTARAGLTLVGDGPLVAWFGNQRVQFAKMGEHGVAPASVVGRVSGELQQPPPSIFPVAEAPNRWYVAWRGYESAVPEPFVARVTCE